MVEVVEEVVTTKELVKREEFLSLSMFVVVTLPLLFFFRLVRIVSVSDCIDLSLSCSLLLSALVPLSVSLFLTLSLSHSFSPCLSYSIVTLSFSLSVLGRSLSLFPLSLSPYLSLFPPRPLFFDS